MTRFDPAAYLDRFRAPAPYAHQLEGVRALVERHHFALFFDPQTGKSRTVVDAACVLAERGEIGTVVVVAPFKALSTWAHAEFGQIKAYAWRPCSVYRAHKEPELEWKDDSPGEKLCWIVTNYEAIRSSAKRLEEIVAAVERRNRAGRGTLLVCDESSYIENRTSAQSKAVHKLRNVCQRAVLLNGTPGDPLGQWNQFNTLSRKIVGEDFGNNFYAFRAKYCNPPEAPIWMADGQFKQLGDIKIGDEVIGWTEKTSNHKYERTRLCRSIVKAISKRNSDLVKVTMASGRILRCTIDHLWSNGSSSRGQFKKQKKGKSTKIVTPRQRICLWTTVCGVPHINKNGRPPKKEAILRHVVEPSYCPPGMERLAGWLGGIYDGEGSGKTISQCQNANPIVHAKIKEALTILKIPFKEYNNCGTSNFYITGGIQSNSRFLAICQPNKRKSFERKCLWITGFSTPDKVVKIEPDGHGLVISLETSTGNYIAWGYMSKNCNMESIYVSGGRKVTVVSQKVPYKNLEDLSRRTAPYVLRVAKKDCLDLPPKIGGLNSTGPLFREVALSEESWKRYKQLRKEALIALGDGDVQLEPNAGVRILRLAQLTSGHHGGAPEDGGAAKVTEVSSEKIDYVVNAVADADDRYVIVWTRWVPTRVRLMRRLAELPGVVVRGIYGGQREDEREESRQRFLLPELAEDGKRYVLVAQPQAGGMCLSLPLATRNIFESNTTRLLDRLQAEERSYGPAQRSTLTIEDVVAVGPDGQRTIDASIFEALRAHQEVSKLTARWWRKELER